METKERIIWAVFAIFSIPALIISNLTGGFTFVITTVVVVLAVLVAIKGITEIHQNHTSKGLVYIFLALITVALSLFLR